MDIGRAFTYPFEDKDWLKKIAIGGASMLVLPLMPVLALGYTTRHLRNLLEGRELPLPEWDDLGAYLSAGIAPVVALIVYLWIPFGILSWLGALGDSVCLGVLFWIIRILYLIAFAGAYSAMFIRYARSDDYSAFYAFPDIIGAIRENPKQYATLAVLISAMFLAAFIVGGIACGIGVIFTSFIALLVSAHLLAQVDRGTQPTVGTL